MLNLTLGILTYNAPKTLERTINSLFTNNVNIFFDKILLYINPSSNLQVTETAKQTAKNFNIPFFVSKKNNHIGPGFKWLAENSKTENVLLLEDDFYLIEQNKKNIFNILYTGINFLNKNEANAVRLRSRKYPGHPLFSLWLKDQEYKCLTHLAECVHWKENPELNFTQYCKKISNNPVWYSFDSKYANFTNNPCIYNTDFYIKNIASVFCQDGSNIEDTATSWWTNQNFKIITGNGLFTHERLDGK